MGHLQSLLVISRILCARAAIRTITIDDTTGDEATGAKPTYLPTPETNPIGSVSPWAGPECKGCKIQPDPKQVHGGTWHGATYHPAMDTMSFEFPFAGAEISVFFVFPPLLEYVTCDLAFNVTLDGQHDSTYFHNPTDTNPNAYVYNFRSYYKTGLSNGGHWLKIETGPGYGHDAYVAFDYAAYTWDDSNGPIPRPQPPSTFTSKTPAAPIAPGSPTQTESTGATSVTSTSISLSLPASASATGILSSDHSNFSTKPSTAFFTPGGAGAGVTSTDGPGGIGVNSQAKHVAVVVVIVGGVVGGIAILILIAVLVLLLRRRRRQQDPLPPEYNPEPNPILNVLPAQSDRKSATLYPNRIPPSGASPGSAMGEKSSLRNAQTTAELKRARQRELQRQLETVQAEMRTLRADLQGTDRQPTIRSLARRRGNDQEVEGLKEYIRVMNEQMQNLREQLDSAWAQGLSDEPPPGYTPQLAPMTISPPGV